MSSRAIKTLAFYSLPLTRRKVKILNVLIDNYLSLANFFVERGLEVNVPSKVRLHELSYEESKRIVPSDKIHSKYRYTALEVASTILKNHVRGEGRGLRSKEGSSNSTTRTTMRRVLFLGL